MTGWGGVSAGRCWWNNEPPKPFLRSPYMEVFQILKVGFGSSVRRREESKRETEERKSSPCIDHDRDRERHAGTGGEPSVRGARSSERAGPYRSPTRRPALLLSLSARTGRRGFLPATLRPCHSNPTMPQDGETFHRLPNDL
ncbi:hypothetical protein ANANG_G00195470 [Anguilla anguilla]|uniref:Uncharacterized protein n=1 Tax=Anguilla anguilla TaxID=7936 RepID=A0A9D3RSC0_ANGAN|nr:hypothetical protein ANANG_G00195470 [Anguilla anguilla]